MACKCIFILFQQKKLSNMIHTDKLRLIEKIIEIMEEHLTQHTNKRVKG